MRRIAIFIISTLLFSYTLPFASAVTETQFSDGTTTFTHVFSGNGDSSTPGVTMPYGANVERVEFEVEGSASTTNWFNRTTNADFGGEGVTGTSQQGWSINQGGWYYGYRQNVKVSNDEVQLRPSDATSYWSLSNQNEVTTSSGGSINTTGQYFSSSESGLDGITNTSTLSMSGGTWGSYMGPIVKQGNEIHIVRSANTNGGINTINRYNAATNAYISTASINYGNCSSSNVAYLVDMTSDGDGTVWMASFGTSTSANYGLSKWTVSGSTYTCDRFWNMAELGGISFDPNTDEMYLVKRVRQSNTYTVNLERVSRTQPAISLDTWSLGTISPTGGQSNPSSYVKPVGLDVQMPRVTLNVYCYYYLYTYSYCDDDRLSWMNVYHIDTNSAMNLAQLQGEVSPAEGHTTSSISSFATYGLERIDGKLATTCFYTAASNYCPSSTSRKILLRGDGVVDWMDAPTNSAATMTSSIKTITRAVSEIKLDLAATWEPTGTSVDFEITNDGGTTWRRANNVGAVVTFQNAGNQLGWRAWLNGSGSNTSLIDSLALSYEAKVAPSGQLRVYRLSSATYPVAAQVWWNESTPGGSALDIYFRSSSSCSSGTRINIVKGTPIAFSTTSGYLSLCIDFDAGTNNEYSPILHDLNVLTYANAPRNVKYEVVGRMNGSIRIR
jgi:hypothetical protein